MSRWHYHEALFVDGPWAGEYRRVITGVRAISGPAEKTRWWQVGLLRPQVVYRHFRVTPGVVTANGYPVTEGQGVFAINQPVIEVRP